MVCGSSEASCCELKTKSWFEFDDCFIFLLLLGASMFSLHDSYMQIKSYREDNLGNCQRPVFSLGVPHHIAKNNKPVKIWAQLVIEVARK